MSYINHVISTKNAKLSGVGNAFRTVQRPTHDGVDLVDENRKEHTQDVYIIAIADGTVTDTIVGNSIGYSVSIAHEGKILTRYFHMKAGSVRVRAGQKVKKGDILGVMGTTGESTGIHLHFAVKENSTAWDNGYYVDPEAYLYGIKTIGGSSFAGLTQEQKNFITNIIAPLAVADMKKNKILASITLAQACIETGYGKSAIMMKNNSPFGVKATETWLKNGGRAYNANTGEHINGQNVTITAAFRAYNSLADAVEDHASILKLPYYNKSKGGKVPYDIIGETDYAKAAECLLPYATGPTYVQSVKAVIELYNLTQYDKGIAAAVIPEPSNPPVIVSPPTQSTQIFKEGNKVKILPEAVMYAGTTVKIPAKYKNKAYTVQQVKPDKILIAELYSWVLTKDLQKVA